RAADAALKTELAEYQRQVTSLVRLVGVLHEAIKAKVKRLKQIVGRGARTARIDHVRAALTPRPHLEWLLDGAAEFFCAHLPEGERPVRRFRVGLYVCRDGVMTPVHGVSNREPGYNPFTSFRAHGDRFRLDSTDPAHVV